MDMKPPAAYAGRREVRPPRWWQRTWAKLVFLALFGAGVGLWLATLVPREKAKRVVVPRLHHLNTQTAAADATVEESESAEAELPWPGIADVALLPALARAAFEPGNYRRGELVLRAATEAELAALLARVQAAGGELLAIIPGLRAARVRFPNAASAGEFLGEGVGEGNSADLNYLVSLPTPQQNANIGMFAPGSMVPFGETALAFMGVPENNGNWGSGLTLAILDTGISPAIAAMLNGARVTELDYVGGARASTGSHADNVAALLSGTGDLRGIVPGANIVNIRVLDNDNIGDVFTVVEGLSAAIERGANVVSLSLGTDSPNALLQAAVEAALAKNVVLVAAVGNDGTQGVSYPAAYDGVIAVGAVDGTGQRATFSNYGPEVDIMAPGVGLSTITTGRGSTNFTGTSAAAPLVAGVITSLLAGDYRLSGQDAASLVTQYANYAGPSTDTGTNPFYGAGVISVDRLLNRTNTHYFDMAAADVYVDMTKIDVDANNNTATVPMQVSVQNRGNAPYAVAQVTVNVNGQSSTQFLNSFAPGQVRSITYNVPVKQLLTQQGLEVRVNVNGVGFAEGRTDNNQLSRQLRLVTPAATPQK